MEPLLPPVGPALWVASAEAGGLGVIRAGGVSTALDERSRRRLKALELVLIRGLSLIGSLEGVGTLEILAIHVGCSNLKKVAMSGGWSKLA